MFHGVYVLYTQLSQIFVPEYDESNVISTLYGLDLMFPFSGGD